jgi:hypothetical protein
VVIAVDALLTAMLVVTPLSVANTVGVADGFWLNDAINAALAAKGKVKPNNVRIAATYLRIGGSF